MASFRKRYPEQVKTFNTKSEAEAWARDIGRDMDRGSFISRVEAESATLKACIDRYTRDVGSSPIILIFLAQNFSGRSTSISLTNKIIA